MSGRYFIRVRGRKHGPFTAEQLQALARRGRFARHYEVSTDGRSWRQASEFPELFAAAGEEEGDSYGEDEFGEPNDSPPARTEKRGRSPSTSEDNSLNEPLDSPPARPATHRRPSSKANDDNFVPPPAVDFDDFYSSGSEAGPRRRRGGERSVPAPPRTSIPLYDDPLDGTDDDEPLDEPPETNRHRPQRKPSKPADDSDLPLWEAEEEAPRISRSRRKEQRPKVPPAAKPPVTRPEPDDDDEEEVPAEKKSGGFFGLFRRKEADVEELLPHLKELHERSSRLRKEDFKLDQIMLIGSKRQELPVVGHEDSGDGIQTLGLLIMIAYQTRSTDIHLEPKIDSCDARMRVDGMLVPVVQIPKDVATRVAGVVKVLCAIDFAGQLGIQEGSFSATAPGRRSDFRVSFTPSVHGQKLAIRILDLANSPQSLEGLGAPKSLITRLQNVMRQNSGMILVCGPTGSGKTTTLYSLIRGIDRKARNVMTIEDPVEYQIEGVTQSSVDAGRGKNFSDMLRALLRQDPDVLLLGEIRDAESAKISMQATMTGHLVLSTVHAQDTINTVFRLLDLGADPNMVASALNMVLAQRLVRALCTHCRKRRAPKSDEKRRLGQLAPDMIYDATGCARCLGTGFSGRRAVFELLEINDRMKDLMLKKPLLTELKAAAKGPGFVTLRGDGYRLVAQGVTTFSEIDRMIGLER